MNALFAVQNRTPIVLCAVFFCLLLRQHKSDALETHGILPHSHFNCGGKFHSPDFAEVQSVAIAPLFRFFVFLRFKSLPAAHGTVVQYSRPKITWFVAPRQSAHCFRVEFDRLRGSVSRTPSPNRPSGGKLYTKKEQALQGDLLMRCQRGKRTLMGY